jgi:hypothetical protein
MPHKSGVVAKLGVEPKFQFEESPLYDDERGVGGSNRTPCLMKPLNNNVLVF